MRRATLIVRYKDPEGTWRRAIAAHAANGCVKPGHALIDGRVRQVQDYQYQVRYYENRRAKYVSAGTSAAEAAAEASEVPSCLFHPAQLAGARVRA